MNEDQEPQIQEGIEQYLRKAEQITTASRRAKWAYYNEHIGSSVKILMDRLFTSLRPIRITAGKLSVNTIRLQFYQGIQYVIDYMDDTEQTYLKRYRNTRCVCYRNEGYIELHIRYRERILEGHEVVTNWREEFEAFIESAEPGKRFYYEMALTDDDVAWARNLIEPLGSMFIADINNTKILVIRDII